MASYSKRREHFKNVLLGKGKNISQQQQILRKNFISRLKSLRYKEVDKFRQLIEKDLSCITIDFDNEVKHMLNSDQIVEILSQVEMEILEKEAEQHVLDTEKEMESILVNLSNICSCCNVNLSQRNICDSCEKLFSETDFSNR